MDTTTLMLSVVFGSIGMGLFVFGKKQGRPIHLLAGLLLMVLPGVVPGAVWSTLVCTAVMVAPFLIAL